MEARNRQLMIFASKIKLNFLGSGNFKHGLPRKYPRHQAVRISIAELGSKDGFRQNRLQGICCAGVKRTQGVFHITLLFCVSSWPDH